MAANNREQGDEATTFIAVIFIFVLFIGFWWFFRNHIISGLITIKMLWVNIFKYILGDSLPSLNNAYDLMTIYTPKEIDMSYLMTSTLLYSFLYTPILSGILIFYALRVLKKVNKQKLTRQFSSKTLTSSEVSLWAWTLPVLKIDLTNTPINSGKWGMAKNPKDFCRKYNLLLDIGNDNPNEKAAKDELLNREKTKKLFISQLGPLWDDIESLPKYAQALLLSFVAHADNEKELAVNCLSKLAISMANKNPDYSFVPTLKDKYLGTPLYREIVSKNAYSYNVLGYALKKARDKGVLPPAYFIWLKPLDRVLWFSLNCVGRKTPFCEVAGIFSQGLTEEVCGRKIITPCVDQAVDGLSDELKKIDLTN